MSTPYNLALSMNYLKFLLSTLFVIGLIGTVEVAHAGMRGIYLADTPQSYRSECSGCHIAFPPDLLPASSWEKIMDGLADHFGSNAQVEKSVHKEIEYFLIHNAGQSLGLKKGGSDLHITDTLWFNRMHGKTKKHFNDPLIGRGSNCGACHVHAENGRFDENRIPGKAEWSGLKQ